MTRPWIMAVLLAVAGAGAMTVAMYLSRPSGPLVGESMHDFGRVGLSGSSTAMTHTFTLHNRSDEDLTVAAFKSSCGCTTAEPSTQDIPPGGDLDVRVTLRLTHAGYKRTHVDVILAGDEDPMRLWVEAVGERAVGLYAQQTDVRLTADGTIPLIAICEMTESSEPPGDPRITGPDAVDVAFVGWEFIETRDFPGITVHRWRGSFRATWSGEDLPDASDLVFELQGAEPTRVRVLAP